MNSVLESYGLVGSLRLAWHTFLTRITFPGARIVRRPVYLRGRRHMRFGRGFTSGPGLRIDAFGTGDGVLISIGDDVQLNDAVHIAAIGAIEIGNRVLIASRVFITDHNHGSYTGEAQDSPLSPPATRKLSFAPVRIEDDVWIGENVSVLPGVTIGRGAVIGTGSVVTRDVPAFCIAAGVPARVIKRWDPDTNRWERL
jgi:lipopolysaccharide O-acetyltransferase